MICVETAAQDFEAVSTFVMPSILAVSGGASTTVVGLYLVRSDLEQTCKDFLSRCVSRLGMNTATRAGLAPSGRPTSNIGFRSSVLSLRCQFGIRLMFLAIPVLVDVNGYVKGNAKNVTWYAALNR